jgi:hypothetical protein
MLLAGVLALVTTAASGLLCALALAGLRRSDNAVARRYAKYSAWLSLLWLPMITSVAMARAMYSTGPESKAYYLARGISEGMNAGALNIPIGLTAVVLWIVARRRIAALKSG